jgi:hypothetical protein
MNILAIHPDDSPWTGPWSGTRWDLVIDLGWAGTTAYPEWECRLGCPVVNVYDSAREIDDLRAVNRLLDVARGRLVDRHGIDWLEIWSPLVRWDLEVILAMKRLAERIPRGARISTTRSSLHASALAALAGSRVEPFSRAGGTTGPRRVRRYARAAATLNPRQLLEIAFDKWDPVYDVRRLIAREPPALGGAVTLLPSGYANVSHAAGAYAAMLPDRRFLLVSTRGNGTASSLPANVTASPLASYAMASDGSFTAERGELSAKWTDFTRRLVPENPELSIACRLGVFDNLIALAGRGLRLRNAWINVFRSHQVEAVLCGDENNPVTRLPLILARERGVPALSCHHGALDFQPLVKHLSADLYLVKGEMEADFLVRVCGLAPSRVFVGAAALPESGTRTAAVGRGDSGPIVFFSEPYELQLGRVDELYRQVLPRLAAAASATGRRLIVKLHPFESLRGRTAVMRSVLAQEQFDHLQIVSGPLIPELLERAWCGVTVESSVAVECALHRTPCFLCGWFDVVRHGYMRQYARFGAGVCLQSPQDLDALPALVPRHQVPASTASRLRTEIAPEILDQLLSGRYPHIARSTPAAADVPILAAS